MASPTIPSLSEIIQNVRADFLSETGADAYIRRRPEYVFSRVIGALAKGLYSYILDRYNQAYYDTCTDEEFFKWSTRYGITQNIAVQWTGVVTFTGTPTTNIPAGTALQRSDGEGYTTDALAVIDGGGSIDVNVTADTAGSLGSNEVGTTLSLTTPIPGVDSDATVLSTAVDGSDVETRAQMQERLRLRLSNPFGASGPGSYELTALSVAGVTRAWEFPGLDGAGTVPVAFARDDDVSPIPDSGERAAVLAALQAAAPVTAIPSVIEIAASTLNVTISSLVPDTATVRAAVQTSLEDLVVREGAPGGTLTPSQISSAISAADGEFSHILDSPTADQVYDTDELPVFGTLTVN